MSVKPTTTQLKTGDIVVDETLYPRTQWSEDLVKRYANALEAGETLPMIVVGRDGPRYVLLDGRHRLRAHQKRFAASVTVIVSPVAPDAFFAEGVRLNARHGTPLTAQEVLEAAQRLSRQGLKPDAISKVVALSVSTVQRMLVSTVQRLPPARSAQSIRRETGRSHHHHVGRRHGGGERAESATPILTEGLTVGHALAAIENAVEHGEHRRVPADLVRTWGERLRALADACDAAAKRGAA